MRPALAGFLLGAIAAAGAFVLVQRLLIVPAARDLTYRFSTCVFGQSRFPEGDLDNGRMIRRCLLPVRISTRFYDAQYREVKQADRPGRYGAVVRIAVTPTGPEIDRFVTLYRTPAKIYWDTTPLPIAAELPAELGLDPAVLRNQQRQTGALIESGLIDDDGNAAPALAVLLAGLAETSPADPPAVARTNAWARDVAWWYGLRVRIGLTEKYPRLVDLPRGYGSEPGKKWPLILFLDNADDRDNLPAVRQSGLAGRIARGREIPAVVVSPVCPAGEPWKTEVLSALLDEIEAKYRIDPARISITGISLGGDAAWEFALAHPERLAAIVPICGEGDPADAARLKDLPVWAFHGAKDDIMPVSETTGMVEAIRRAGGQPRLTIFPDAGHDAWDQAYALDELTAWLLAQKRTDR